MARRKSFKKYQLNSGQYMSDLINDVDDDKTYQFLNNHEAVKYNIINMPFITACNITNESFSDVSFNKCDFVGVDFYNCTFINCKFVNMIFNRCNFYNCKFNKSEFDIDNLCHETDFYRCSFYTLYNIKNLDIDMATFYLCTFSAPRISILDDIKAKAIYNSKQISDCIFECCTFYNMKFNDHDKFIQFDNCIYDYCDNIPFNFIISICPEEGSFYAYKILNSCNDDHKWYLAKLYIPEDAKRVSHIESKKCRCDKAKVIYIYNLKTKKLVKRVNLSTLIPSMTSEGMMLKDTLYKTGEYVYPDSFDDNRLDGCTHGIHFYANKIDLLNSFPHNEDNISIAYSDFEKAEQLFNEKHKLKKARKTIADE